VIAFIVVGSLGVGFGWMMVDGGAWPPRAGVSAKLLGWAAEAWSFVSPFDDRRDLRDAGSAAYEPPRDPWAIPGLARLGYRVVPKPGEPTDWGPRGPGVRAFTLAREFRRVLLQELIPPVVMLAVLLAAVYAVPWRRTVPPWFVVGFVALDLGAASWLRPTEFTARGKLVERSPVLSYLANHAKGQRIQDSRQNLAMITGSAPINSYRTVDIPFVTQYFNPDPTADQMTWYHRISDRTDVRWEIWDADPSLVAGRPRREGERDEAFVDPLLAEIHYGRKFVSGFGQAATSFVIRQRDPELASRAWYWDVRTDPDRFERLLERQAFRGKKPSDLTYHWLYVPPLQPVPLVRSEPELLEFEMNATGPGMLIVSELAYPGWEAKIKWSDGRSVPAQALVSEAGCLMVRITMTGEYRVELNYQSRPFEMGVAISAAGFAVWVATLLFATSKRRIRQSSPRAPREAVS
jgi:hypothetical protein